MSSMLSDSSFPPPPVVELALDDSEASSSSPSPSSPPDIIPAYLPACQVHLFSGASGAGKTALTFSLLSSMFSGGNFFGLSPRKPAFVGYLAADRTWNDHRIWLATVGLSDLPYYSLIDDSALTGKRLRERSKGDRFDLFKYCIAGILANAGLVSKADSVEVALRKMPKDSFFIVDPVSLFLGGDLLKYDSVYSYMVDLNQFCIKYSCTILGIAHAGKQKSDPGQRYARAQDRIVGTTAQTGCAGTTMHLAPATETGEDWAEFTMVPHHAPEKTLKMVRNEIGLFVACDPTLPTVKQKREQSKLELLAARLLPFFPQDFSAIHVTKLFETISKPEPDGLGLKRSVLYRYLDVLSSFNYITHGEVAGTWKLLRKN